MRRKVSLMLSLIMIVGLLGLVQTVNAATYNSSISVGQTKMYTARANYAVETATWSVRGNDDAVWIVSQDDISCTVIGKVPTTGSDYAILRCDYYYFRNGLLMSGYTDYYISVNSVNSGTSDEPVYVTSISVSPSSVVIAEGDDYLPTINVYPYNATRKFLYFDEPEGIVTFWEDGHIRGNKPGTATVTIMAKYGAKTTTIRVTVVCDHNYEKEEITKQPQLGVAGEKKRYCTKCKTWVTEVIPALTKKDAYKPLVKDKAYGINNKYFVKLSPPASEIDHTKKSIKIGNTKLYYMEPTGAYVGFAGQMTEDSLINNMQIVNGASEVIYCGVVTGGETKPKAADFGVVKRVVLKKETSLTDKQLMAADVNSDGVISAADFGAIKRVVLKKSSNFQ